MEYKRLSEKYSELEIKLNDYELFTVKQNIEFNNQAETLEDLKQQLQFVLEANEGLVTQNHKLSLQNENVKKEVQDAQRQIRDNDIILRTAQTDIEAEKIEKIELKRILEELVQAYKANDNDHAKNIEISNDKRELEAHFLLHEKHQKLQEDYKDQFEKFQVMVRELLKKEAEIDSLRVEVHNLVKAKKKLELQVQKNGMLEQNELEQLERIKSLTDALHEKNMTPTIENKLLNQYSNITKENNENLMKLNLSNQENQNLKQELDKSLEEVASLKQLREKQEIQLKEKYNQQLQDEIRSNEKEHEAKFHKYNLDLRLTKEEINKLASQHEKDREDWRCKLRQEVQSGITSRADLEKDHRLKLKEMEKEYQRKEK